MRGVIFESFFKVLVVRRAHSSTSSPGGISHLVSVSVRFGSRNLETITVKL